MVLGSDDSGMVSHRVHTLTCTRFAHRTGAGAVWQIVPVQVSVAEKILTHCFRHSRSQLAHFIRGCCLEPTPLTKDGSFLFKHLLHPVEDGAPILLRMSFLLRVGIIVLCDGHLRTAIPFH